MYFSFFEPQHWRKRSGEARRQIVRCCLKSQHRKNEAEADQNTEADDGCDGQINGVSQKAEISLRSRGKMTRGLFGKARFGE